MSAPVDMTIVRGVVDIMFKVTGDVNKAVAASKAVTQEVEKVAQATQQAVQPATHAFVQLKKEVTDTTESLKGAKRSFGEITSPVQKVNRGVVQLGQQMRFIARDFQRISLIAGLALAPIIGFFILVARTGGRAEGAVENIKDAMERIAVVIDDVLGPFLEFFATIAEGVADFLEANRAIGVFVGALLIAVAVGGTLFALFLNIVATIGLVKFGLLALVKEVSLTTGASFTFVGALKAMVQGINPWVQGTDQMKEQLGGLSEGTKGLVKGGFKLFAKGLAGLVLGFLAFQGIASIFEDVSDAISPLVDIFVDFLQPIIPIISDITNAIADFLDAFPILKQLFGILSLFALDFLFFGGRFSKLLKSLLKGLFEFGGKAAIAISKPRQSLQTLQEGIVSIPERSRQAFSGAVKSLDQFYFASAEATGAIEALAHGLRQVKTPTAVAGLKQLTVSLEGLPPTTIGGIQALNTFADTTGKTGRIVQTFRANIEDINRTIGREVGATKEFTDASGRVIGNFVKVASDKFQFLTTQIGRSGLGQALTGPLALVEEKGRLVEKSLGIPILRAFRDIGEGAGIVEGSFAKIAKSSEILRAIPEEISRNLSPRQLKVVGKGIESILRSFPQQEEALAVGKAFVGSLSEGIKSGIPVTAKNIQALINNASKVLRETKLPGVSLEGLFVVPPTAIIGLDTAIVAVGKSSQITSENVGQLSRVMQLLHLNTINARMALEDMTQKVIRTGVTIGTALAPIGQTAVVVANKTVEAVGTVAKDALAQIQGFLSSADKIVREGKSLKFVIPKVNAQGFVERLALVGDVFESIRSQGGKGLDFLEAKLESTGKGSKAFGDRLKALKTEIKPVIASIADEVSTIGKAVQIPTEKVVEPVKSLGIGVSEGLAKALGPSQLGLVQKQLQKIFDLKLPADTGKVVASEFLSNVARTVHAGLPVTAKSLESVSKIMIDSAKRVFKEAKIALPTPSVTGVKKATSSVEETILDLTRSVDKANFGGIGKSITVEFHKGEKTILRFLSQVTEEIGKAGGAGLRELTEKLRAGGETTKAIRTNLKSLSPLMKAVQAPATQVAQKAATLGEMIERASKAKLVKLEGGLASLSFQVDKSTKLSMSLESVLGNLGTLSTKQVGRLAAVLKNGTRGVGELRDTFRSLGLEAGEFFPEIASSISKFAQRGIAISVEEVQANILGAIGDAKRVFQKGGLLLFELPSGETLTKPIEAVTGVLEKLGDMGKEAGTVLAQKLGLPETIIKTIKEDITTIGPLLRQTTDAIGNIPVPKIGFQVSEESKKAIVDLINQASSIKGLKVPEGIKLGFEVEGVGTVTKDVNEVLSVLQAIGKEGSASLDVLRQKLDASGTSSKGLLNKLKGVSKGFGALAIAPLGFALPGLLEGLAPIVEQISEPFIRLGEVVSDALEPAVPIFEAIGDFFERVPVSLIQALIALFTSMFVLQKLGFLGPLLTRIAGAFGLIGASGIAGSVKATTTQMTHFGVVAQQATQSTESFGKAQKSLGQKLKGGIKGFAKMTAVGLGLVLLFKILSESEAFGDLFDALGDALDAVAEVIAPLLDILIDWIEENPLLAGTIIALIAAIAGFLSISGGIPGVMGAVNTALGNLAKITPQSALGIVAIVGSIALLVGAFGVFLKLAGESGFSIAEILTLVTVLSTEFGVLTIALSRLAGASIVGGTALLGTLAGISALVLAFGGFLKLIGESGLSIGDTILLVTTLSTVFGALVVGLSRLGAVAVTSGASLLLILSGLSVLTVAFGEFIKAVGASGLGAGGVVQILLALGGAFAAILIPLTAFGRVLDLKTAGVLVIVLGALSLFLGVFKDFIKALLDSRRPTSDIIALINALVIGAVAMIIAITAAVVVLGLLGPVALIGALALGGVILAMAGLVLSLGYALQSMSDFIDAMIRFAQNWEAIKRVILEIGPVLVKGLTDSLNFFRTEFVPALETALREIPPKIVSAFSDGLNEAIRVAGTKIPEFIRSITTAINNSIGALVDAGIAIGKAIGEGMIKGKKSFVNSAIDFIKANLIGSPLFPETSLMRDLPQGGIGVSRAIAEGMLDGIGFVEKAIGGISTALTTTLPTPGLDLVKSLSQVTGPGGFGLVPGLTTPPVGQSPLTGAGNITIGPFIINGATQPIQTAEEIRRIIREELARRTV